MRNSPDRRGLGRNVTRAFGWTFFWALAAFATVLVLDASVARGDTVLLDGGAYAGAQAGYAIPDASFSFDGSGLGDLEADGFRAGAFAGYAFRRDSLIGAVEVDGAIATGDGTLSAAGMRFRIEPEVSAGIGVLAGTVLGDYAMVYARAGYEALVVDASFAGTDTREVLHGVLVGGGAAMPVSDRIALRAEYVYTFFGDKDYAAGDTTLTVESRQGVARLGIVFGF